MKYTYDEETSLHKEVVNLEKYLELPEEDRESNNIYFIENIDSQSDLLQILIQKIDELTAKLKEKKLIE